MTTVAERLDSLTVQGELYERLPDGDVRCYACAHRCLIRPGRRGICKVRFNRDGELRVPWGYVGGLQCDPIEKKPFYHFLPGAAALTFGMLGCDFHCGYCQNWLSSQVLRDSAAGISAAHLREISPKAMVEAGTRMGAQVLASSYNEPLITSEWAVAIFREAAKAGLKCVYVSNGNATPEVIEYLAPHLTGFKIDLKTMRDRGYRQLGGVLDNVLGCIQMAHDAGLWVEIVTLVVPGFNDSTDELMHAARFIASVSPDIPWHVTAFHKDYRMRDPQNTSVQTLIRAAEIGQEAGLRFVYAGNIPGAVGDYENTNCSQCGELLIERHGFYVLGYHLTSEGTCPRCGTAIPGVWHDDPAAVGKGGGGLSFLRRPRRVA
jgi:pyruvate formate lyase activating enzyme